LFWAWIFCCKKLFGHKDSALHAQAHSVGNDQKPVVTVASVVSTGQVKSKSGKLQKSGFVRVMRLSRLTGPLTDAKLDLKAMGLTDRFDIFIR